MVQFSKTYTGAKANFLVLSLLVIGYISQIRSEGTHNMSYYVLWARSIAEGRLLEIYHATPESVIQNSDSLTVPYTPLSQYFTGAMSWLLLQSLPDERSTYVISVNLICVLFTFLTVYLFYRSRTSLNLKSPLLYLLTPAVFLISPKLAYEDSIMTFFLVSTYLTLRNEKYLLAGFFAGCAIFSKQLALMPVVALFLLLIYSKKLFPVIRFSTGSLASSFLILSPFIFTGNLFLYFKAQGLTSVHTMLSAQAANFPWLASLVYRITDLGLVDGLREGGNGLRITSDAFRQLGYLSSGVLTILIFVAWAIYWGRKIGPQNIDPLFGASVMIFSYHLFNFGVHENHIFMLVPTLFLLTHNSRMWGTYKLTASALGIAIFSAFGLGIDSRLFSGFSLNHPLRFTLALGLSFVLFFWGFIRTIRTNPNHATAQSPLIVGKVPL